MRSLKKTEIYSTFILSAFLAAPGFSATPAAPAKAAPADALAVINGEAISPAEFSKDWNAFVDEQKRVLKPEQMTPEWEQAKKKLLLDKIVDQRLVLQEAKKRKIAVSKKDLAAAVDRVKEKFKFDAKGQPLGAAERDSAFKRELAAQNLTEAKFEEILKNQLRAVALTNKVVKEKVKPLKEEQVRKLYETVKARLAKPDAAPTNDPKENAVDSLARYAKAHMAERVRLRHILVFVDPSATAEARAAASKKAADIKAKLDGGALFVETAKQYSDDKRTAGNGGDAGYIMRGDVKELDDAAFSLSVGGVSGVVSTKLGYEIVKVTEKIAAAEEFQYEDARSYLADYLMRAAEQDAYADFLAGLRKAAHVDLRASFAKPTVGG